VPRASWLSGGRLFGYSFVPRDPGRGRSSWSMTPGSMLAGDDRGRVGRSQWRLGPSRPCRFQSSRPRPQGGPLIQASSRFAPAPGHLGAAACGQKGMWARSPGWFRSAGAVRELGGTQGQQIGLGQAKLQRRRGKPIALGAVVSGRASCPRLQITGRRTARFWATSRGSGWPRINRPPPHESSWPTWTYRSSEATSRVAGVWTLPPAIRLGFAKAAIVARSSSGTHGPAETSRGECGRSR